MDPDTAYMADRILEDGSFLVFFRTEEDIAELIERLKGDGIDDEILMNPEYWLSHTCNRMADGACVLPEDGVGPCEPITVGNFSYCRRV